MREMLTGPLNHAYFLEMHILKEFCAAIIHVLFLVYTSTRKRLNGCVCVYSGMQKLGHPW